MASGKVGKDHLIASLIECLRSESQATSELQEREGRAPTGNGSRSGNPVSNPGPLPLTINWRLMALGSAGFSVLAMAAILNDYRNNPYQQGWLLAHPYWLIGVGATFVTYIVIIVASILRRVRPMKASWKPVRVTTGRPKVRDPHEEE